MIADILTKITFNSKTPFVVTTPGEWVTASSDEGLKSTKIVNFKFPYVPMAKYKISTSESFQNPQTELLAQVTCESSKIAKDSSFSIKDN